MPLGRTASAIVSEHQYPSSAIYGDYARAAFGFGLTAGPLALLDLATVMAAIFAALAALFGWFGGRTAVRQASRVQVSPAAIAVRGPIERRIPWAELRRVKLAYYAPGRGRRDGWLQLTLRGSGGPIRLDSNLEGFDRILRAVHAQLGAQDVPVDPMTATNFGELGMAVSSPDEPAQRPAREPARPAQPRPAPGRLE